MSHALFPLCAVSILCSSPVSFPSTPASRHLRQPSRFSGVLPAPSLHPWFLYLFPSPVFLRLRPPAPHPFISLVCVVISSIEFVESSVVFAWSCCSLILSLRSVLNKAFACLLSLVFGSTFICSQLDTLISAFRWKQKSFWYKLMGISLKAKEKMWFRLLSRPALCLKAFVSSVSFSSQVQTQKSSTKIISIYLLSWIFKSWRTRWLV